MQGKLVWALALVGLLVLIDPSTACKNCGAEWCACPGSSGGYSRGWEVDRPSRISWTLPVSPVISGIGGGIGGIGGGIGGIGGSLGGHGISGGLSNICSVCGGYNRGYPYHPREEYGYSRPMTCKCSPRRHRYRYEDY